MTWAAPFCPWFAILAAACVADLGAANLRTADAARVLGPTVPNPACKEARGAGDLGLEERRRTFDGGDPAPVDTVVQGHPVAALGLVEQARSCAVVAGARERSYAVVVGAQASMYGVVVHPGSRLVAGWESLCAVPSCEGHWEIRPVVAQGILFAAA